MQAVRSRPGRARRRGARPGGPPAGGARRRAGAGRRASACRWRRSWPGWGRSAWATRARPCSCPRHGCGWPPRWGRTRDHARFTLENGGARARGVAFRHLGRRRWPAGRRAARPGGHARGELTGTAPSSRAWCCARWRRRGRASAAVLGEDEPLLGRRSSASSTPARDGRAWRRGRAWRAARELLRPPRRGLRRAWRATCSPPATPCSWSAPTAPAGASRSEGCWAAWQRAGSRLRRAGTRSLRTPGARAAPWPHVLALDPRAAAARRGAAGRAALGRPGFAHLAWGQAEIEFALAAARAGLDLRPALVGVFRALRDGGRRRRSGRGRRGACARAARRRPLPALRRGLRSPAARAPRARARVVHAPRRGRAGLGAARRRAAPTSSARRPIRAYAERLRVAESCLGGRPARAAAVA